MVLVGRPDHRIDSCTIKGGSRVSSLIVSFGEISNHCILGIIIFLGSCLDFVFVRVLCGVRLSCASSSDASQRDQVLEACHPLWCQWTC